MTNILSIGVYGALGALFVCFYDEHASISLAFLRYREGENT